MARPKVWVVVWHNKQWLSWRECTGTDGTESSLPNCETFQGATIPTGLWVKADNGDHVFGPAGESAKRWHYLLPSFINHGKDGTVKIRNNSSGAFTLGASSRLDDTPWCFDYNNKLVTGDAPTTPYSAFALKLGCATFMGVLVKQPQHKLEAVLDKLNEFFTEKFEVAVSKALGFSRIPSLGALQLDGYTGTYLVSKTPEMRLGKGSFGEVFRGVELKTENLFAIKFLDNNPEADWIPGIMKREKRNFQLIRNKYIIGCQDICASGSALVMDYIPYGSVDQMYRGRAWPTFNLFNLADQILRALWYMHTKLDMAHRDIQPNNILVKWMSPLRVVLADIGHAAKRTDQYIWGHPFYRPPESYETKTSHCKADIWSLGATILELALDRRFDFDINADPETFPRRVERRFKEAEDKISPALRKLLKWMLTPNPDLRLGALGCLRLLQDLSFYPPVQLSQESESRLKASLAPVREDSSE